jgi:hypothetical protein
MTIITAQMKQNLTQTKLWVYNTYDGISMPIKLLFRLLYLWHQGRAALNIIRGVVCIKLQRRQEQL